ncbi:hypothetical protein B0H17DRAFT_1036793 [Mycena rosella]|uniref:UBC core domain-containing protein n=1 Tax=Mycena rosella TaxID=1033263 RepID=A0AAD7M997_MYCRO|nr:hypothetical protein B0H17DRAFT_1036793 [Mycena rosella]
MSPSLSRRATKFYQQDIVCRIQRPLTADSTSREPANGIVMEVAPQTPFSDPLMRPLHQGEVGVSFYRDEPADSTRREFDRQILPESELVLVDRTFHRGDFCKRSIDDLRSGVVIKARVDGRCEHVVSGERLEGWTTLEELSDRTYAEVGDYVTYDDWVGQLYDEVLVEISTGEIIRLPELGSRLSIGEKGPDILPPPASTVHNLFGFLLGNTRPSPNDMCVHVTHSVYAITWLAVSQALDGQDAESRRRPQQFWSGTDLSKLTLIRSLSDLEMRVGDRVTFKDESTVPGTTHGLDSKSKVVVKTFTVTETQTFVDVLWQDGTKETVRSTDLIPYLNPDEYDCWPGDYVVWNREDEKRPVIIQSVNATHRTASVLIPETGKIELASVLELDPHGTSDTSAMLEAPSDGLGVRRGDFLFVHPEGKTNGSPVVPRVPRIGEVEAWVRDVPFVDGQLAGFRKEMSEMGASIARRRTAENIVEGPILRPSPDNETLMWLGEVIDINLDGTVQLTHPNGAVRSYPLQRLTKLYDGIDQLEDDMWDEVSEGHAVEDHPLWSISEEGGVWEPEDSDSGDDWPGQEYDSFEDEEDGAEGEVPMVNGDGRAWPDAPLDPIDVIPLQLLAPSDDSGSDTPRPEIAVPTPIEVERLPSPDVPKDAADDPPLDELDGEDDAESPWKRFEVLSSAPEDHAYYNSPPAQPSKSFLGRLRNEYRVLASSLPDSILVRAYEDRTDLLRSLIIGPENTPYEDAPFVIDWMLDSNFPHSPPIALNPNLYEEGKVCLSILGTWAGDKNEIWNSARSSLLQAFVSIQGLVLVKEPWFCEPAYEKLRGTEEGIVNSRLYNEKAYVLSRGFVRRALELPPGGLEPEIEWLYHTSGRLDKVVNDAQKLIEKSKNAAAEAADTVNSKADRELAVPRLSAGGIITLDRTLVKLVNLRSRV